MVMILRIAAPRWHGDGDPLKEANCFSFPVKRNYDPWFGVEDASGRVNVALQDEAMDICNGESGGVVCPLRHQCLVFALKNNCGDGIWGGMHEEDRTKMRRFTKEVDWAWHEPNPREGEEPQQEEDDAA